MRAIAATLTCAALAGCALTGCALGAGPWQPGRGDWAVAGSTGTGLDSSAEERREEHQKAKQLRLPEIGGGSTPMYYMNGAFYAGIRQGVSWTRGSGETDWSDGTFMFEGHAGFAEVLFGDRVLVGANLFAAGYGTGDQTAAVTHTYSLFGAELVLKLPVFSRLGVHAAAAPVYGRLSREDLLTNAREKFDVGGWRATAGVDLVLGQLWAIDMVLVIDWHEVRSDDFDGAGADFEGRGLTFQLALGAQ